jgi:hypothetical protein
LCVLPLFVSLPTDRAWTGPIVHPPVAQDLVPVEAEIASAGIVLPEGARVLYVLRGAEQEHLGTSASVVGDLDGDGVRDFVLSGMWFGRFAYGPGGARAYSARSGRRLWEVHGTRNGASTMKGDGFGDALCGTGDVDGDGIDDVAIGAPRFDADRGMVRIVSGRDGRALATIYGGVKAGEPYCNRGDPTFSDGQSIQSESAELGGVLLSAPDLDGDGITDLVIGEHPLGGSRLWAVSSRALKVIAKGKGEAVLLAGVAEARATGPIAACSRSMTLAPGASATTLPGCFSWDKWSDWLRTHANDGRDTGSWPALVDLDGDGRHDVVCTRQELLPEPKLVTMATKKRTYKPAGPVTGLFGYAGTDGAELLALDFDPGTQVMLQDWLDLDGDGRCELIVSTSRQTGATHVDVRSGVGGRLLYRFVARGWSFGLHVEALDDLTGDGRPEVLVTEHEAACSGRAWVISLP